MAASTTPTGTRNPFNLRGHRVTQDFENLCAVRLLGGFNFEFVQIS
jgi:hypothetical protein